MTNNNFSLLLVVAIAVVLYYFVSNKQFDGACGWCPKCGKQTINGNCPACPSLPINHTDALLVLQQLVRGCTHRLRGVVREDMATATDVSAFMTEGAQRLVIITNIDPEKFISLAMSGQKALQQIKAVAISSAIVRGKKNYIVMSIKDGNLSPIGALTANFADAFEYLESTARKQIGPDSNNLVFYIDEDIPCPEEVTPLDEMPISKESCCGGRRY